MKSRQILAIAIAWMSASVFAQNAGGDKTYVLFRENKSCHCIDTEKSTPTVKSTEKRVGKSIFQVFRSSTKPKQELFRVEVGLYVGGVASKFSNYGIADEADFNGDGLTDYSWYGGDDTSFAMHVFLSSHGKYKRIDVLKTVQAAWLRRFKTRAPNLAQLDGDYGLQETILERSANGLVLRAAVEHRDPGWKKTGTYKFRISEFDFKP